MLNACMHVIQEEIDYRKCLKHQPHQQAEHLPDWCAAHFVTEDTADTPGHVPIPERVPSQPLALFLKCFFLLLPCESFQLHVDYARKLEAVLGGRSGERCFGFES